MAVENRHSFAAHALPTPTDTPYQSPTKLASNPGSLHSSSSALSQPSAGHLGSEGSFFLDMSNRDSISSLKNPRFSQNLDVSLIGEIHNLRKEVEKKDAALDSSQKENKRQKAAIGDLEEAIETLVVELTQLREDVKTRGTRERSLEKKRRRYEDDSTSAIDALTAERDRAVSKELEAKKALESERSSKRSLENDLENTCRLHDEERQKYTTEKRSMERKQHVLESRVKTVVLQLDALQAERRQHVASQHHRMDSLQDSVRSLDVGRSESRTSMRTFDDIHGDRDTMDSRASKRSLLSGFEESRPPGVSLAEELDREESDDETDVNVQSEALSSPDTLPEEKVPTRHTEDSKARRLMGLIVDPTMANSAAREAITESSKVFVYADVGTQASLPSPISEVATRVLDTTTLTVPATTQTEDFPSATSAMQPPVDFTDASAQTDAFETAAKPTGHLSTSEVPVIAIRPPSSGSFFHNGVVLPPQTRNVASQVDVSQLTSMRSTSMQTEEIRVDKRPIKIATRIRSTQAVDKARPRTRSGPEVTDLHNIPRRKLRSPPPLEDEPSSPPVPVVSDHYAGVNDDGPLTSQSKGPKRPIRSGSILAGFDDLQRDESDDGLSSVPPIRKTLSKVKDSWKLVPQTEDVFAGPGNDTWDPHKRTSDVSKSKARPATTSKTFHTRPSTATSSQANSNRKASLASTGVDPVPAPPFPVPTRSSSRVIPFSASDGAASPTPYSTSFFTARRAREHARSAKTKDLRKVQSAAAVTKHVHTSSRRPPPLPLNTATSVPDKMSPVVVPTQNQFIFPYGDELPESRAGSDLTELTRSHAAETSIENNNAQTSVVDAIAQTMVGEWMWKYIRKRTSFGITDTTAQDAEKGDHRTIGGVRHKRWVWLAPYERAVIWSSKQPTSGPALLGKGGRKLIIQSVLDVKDETPLPKGSPATASFGRSILILTAERALKITATSEERHYIWLTALSFLSHPTQGIEDLAVPDPISQPESRQPQHHHFRPPSREFVGDGVYGRRSSARDSIRIAKDRSRPSVGSHSFSNPIEIEAQRLSASLPHAQSPWIEDALLERPSEDVADPPYVPRISEPKHTRKRSNTASRIPASLTGFGESKQSLPGTASRHASMPWSSSRGGSGNSTRRSTLTRSLVLDPASGSAGYVAPPMRSPPPVPVAMHLPVRNDFFDAVGTVRMEAFIGGSSDNVTTNTTGTAEEEGEVEGEERLSKASMPSVNGMLPTKRPGGDKEHKKDMRYWGVPHSPVVMGPGTAGVAGGPATGHGRGRGEDPFRGF